MERYERSFVDGWIDFVIDGRIGQEFIDYG